MEAAGSALPVLAAFYALVRDHAAAAAAAAGASGNGGVRNGQPPLLVAELGLGMAAAAPLAQLTAALRGTRGCYEPVHARHAAVLLWPLCMARAVCDTTFFACAVLYKQFCQTP